MKRSLHILALLLFALTQFVAPFAHAHVDGMQGNASIHTGDIPHHLQYPGLSHCHIESHESQAIGLQQEYQRDDAAAIPGLRTTLVQHLPASITASMPGRYDPLHPATFAYHKPHTQAPPA